MLSTISTTKSSVFKPKNKATPKITASVTASTSTSGQKYYVYKSTTSTNLTGGTFSWSGSSGNDTIYFLCVGGGGG